MFHIVDCVLVPWPEILKLGATLITFAILHGWFSQASQVYPGDPKYIKGFMVFYVVSDIQQETVWSPKTTQIVGFLKKAGRANLFANSNKAACLFSLKLA
jgi:hypothetical protein